MRIEEVNAQIDTRFATKAKDWNLVVKTDKIHYSPGERIQMNVTIRNRSKRAIMLMEGALIADYHLSVFRGDQRIRFSRSTVIGSATGSKWSKEVAAGGKLVATVNLHDLVDNASDLSAGQYAINVRRELSNPNWEADAGKGESEAVSAETTFRIVK
jgi:hypothetical protein